MKLTDLTDGLRLAAANAGDFATDLVDPTLRLGVTGLARAGKTVFISALVHNLLHGGRLPLFDAYASGRISTTNLDPQPDDAVPRFAYEGHIEALTGPDRHWPASTAQISESRLTIAYESASFWDRNFRPGRLHIDIVDYPGEWLLDLPLLSMNYAAWSAQSLAKARDPRRAGIAADWLSAVASHDANADASEDTARTLATAFTAFLAANRDAETSAASLPPGRFLMPGDLANSPALTFAPLDIPADARPRRGSLHAMMARRYDAYVSHVVRPFFRDHFARLDRQIVLVDLLRAINSGPAAIRDLEASLSEILAAFRPGRTSWLSRILTRRVDRILFAATKADHLHHHNHDRLEKILRRLVDKAATRAAFAGSTVDALALASVRATHEATISHDGHALDCIVGVPEKGQKASGRTFDGKSEFAIFPGDLPLNPDSFFERVEHAEDSLESDSQVRAEQGGVTDSLLERPESMSEDTPAGTEFVRFRPPQLERATSSATLSLPHIRLDRAIDFLIGDKLA